jgi:cytochrome P450
VTAVEAGHGGLAFAAGREQRCLIGVALGGDQPVTRLTWPTGSPSWLVTGYSTACEVFRDGRFSRSRQAAAMGYRGLVRQMSVTEMDPPDHTRLRALVSRAYSARQLQRIRPAVERKADALLHGLFRNGPVADFNQEVSAPLAFATHCEVLGVPEVRKRTLRALWLRQYKQAGTRPTGPGLAELQLQEYVCKILSDQANPPAGMFADLIAAHRERGVISEAELTGMALSFLLDGPLVAESQLTNAVLCLLTHPDQLAALREEPALLDGAIEELLRYSPASTTSLPRAATDDLMLGPARIRAGDVSRVALPLANRDPEVITAPDRLDITRADSRHLTFGHGVHYCLGARLTRILMHVVLTAVLRWFPDLSLAVPEQDLQWYVTPLRRSVHELPVSWHGVAANADALSHSWRIAA